MSETKQKRERLFAAADADKMPTLVCVGYVFHIGEGHPSKSGVYNVNPVEIQPYGGGRETKFQFLSRPEWFALDGEGRPAFRPKDLKNAEGGKSMTFVYKKMINGRNEMSALEGLAGNAERLGLLEETLVDTPGLDGDESATVLEGIFNDVLIAKDGEDAVEIGYILKQQRVKTDEVDENGKAVYILDKGYELANFWEVTSKNKKKYRDIAEKSAARNKAKGEAISFKVCFDEGVSAPF